MWVVMEFQYDKHTIFAAFTCHIHITIAPRWCLCRILSLLLHMHGTSISTRREADVRPMTGVFRILHIPRFLSYFPTIPWFIVVASALLSIILFSLVPSHCDACVIHSHARGKKQRHTWKEVLEQPVGRQRCQECSRRVGDRRCDTSGCKVNLCDSCEEFVHPQVIIGVAYSKSCYYGGT